MPMKKWFSILAILAVAGAVFAQQFAGKAEVVKKMQFPAHSMSKTPTDTCGLSDNFVPKFSPSGQAYLYGYQGGGYVFGNNKDHVDVCAQGYVYSGSVGIEACAFLFGAKYQNNANTPITIKAYKLDGQAQNQNNTTTTGPGTLLGQTTITMSQVDTTWPNLTIATFPTVLGVYGDFCVAADFSQLTPAGDTAGLVCDKNGDANQLDYAFHQYQGTWYVTDYVFGGLDVDIAIFPIVDRNYVGMNDQNSFYGIRSNSYPNPAKDNMTIEYALDNSTHVTVEIFDVNGKLIREYKQGKQDAGKYSLNVNVSNLQSGKYYFSIKANGTRLMKSFVVE